MNSALELRRFWTVLRREISRFMGIKRQTILAPLLETYLYIAVFGASLGSRIQELDGHPYIVFIIPGLVMMTFAMNAFGNNSASLLQQKFLRAIDDQLSSPVSNLSLLCAFTLGGFLRGALIAAIAFTTASFLVDLPVVHPWLLLASLTVIGLLFSLLGVLVGLRSDTFDNLSFYQQFMLQPLIFLGGVFYSVSLLPDFFETITRFNPVFYMINTVRYGMLGSADVDPYLALGILSAITVGLFFILLALFNRGYKLRV